MIDCNINHDDHKNNGLLTKIWGGPGWTFNHSVTFGYPLMPTEEDKLQYKNYFISLGNVLPCRFCRDSYKKFIISDETALTDEVMKNRETLTKWFYNIHEAVNKKLEINYGVTYDDVIEKYESFRAKCGKKDINGCSAPLNNKAFSFNKLYCMDAPIVPLNIIKPFINLAFMRGLNKKYFIFYDMACKLNGNFTELKKQKYWITRNKICVRQIKYMREQSIPSVETSGLWIGTPTLDELKLLVFLSSNLNKTELYKTLNAVTINYFVMRKKNLIY